MSKLTELEIRNLRPPAQDSLHADGGCLFLRVRKSGAKGWIVRIKRNGVRRVHTLGTWPDMSIIAARAEAARLVAVERGTERVSVADAVGQFMDVRIRPKYRRLGGPEVYARALTSKLGSRTIATVRAVDVSRMIAEYRRTAPVAAMRLLSFTKNFFSWATSFGYVDRSPVADIKAGGFGVTETPRERVLSDDEIRAFWHAEDLSHVALLRFLLLTGLRIQEAQRATVADIGLWAPVDGELKRAQAGDHGAGKWLTIPAAHSKNKRQHRVFLSPIALAQIEPDAAPALFRAVSPTAVQAALHRWVDRHYPEPRYDDAGAVIPRWTAHDLRRSYASRCGSCRVALHVVAKMLNHSLPGGGSLPIYVRSEWWTERQQATIDLAAHVGAVIAEGGV